LSGIVRCREEQPSRAAERRIRRNGIAAVGVELEVEMRVNPVGVARIADEADELAGADGLAVAQAGGVRDLGDAAASIVVLGGEIVVQVDVEIRRAAAPVQVEHAAGVARARPDRDRSVLHRDDRRPALGEDVVSLVKARAARLAEVVVVPHRPDDGKHESRCRSAGRAVRACVDTERDRAGRERGEEESGRPVHEGLSGASRRPEASRPARMMPAETAVDEPRGLRQKPIEPPELVLDR
jgi:hypothetical protein